MDKKWLVTIRQRDEANPRAVERFETFYEAVDAARVLAAHEVALGNAAARDMELEPDTYAVPYGNGCQYVRQECGEIVAQIEVSEIPYIEVKVPEVAPEDIRGLPGGPPAPATSGSLYFNEAPALVSWVPMVERAPLEALLIEWERSAALLRPLPGEENSPHAEGVRSTFAYVAMQVRRLLHGEGPVMFWVVSHYAGSTRSGTLRGVFVHRRAAEAYRTAVQAAEGDSPHVFYRVIRSGERVIDPWTQQPITFYV